MIYQEIWETEHIEWADPKEDGFIDSIGATSSQIEGYSDTTFSVMKFVSPRKALHFIDPSFSPGRGRTIDFLHNEIERGTPVAPAQVWIDPGDFRFFPEIAWTDPRSTILRNLHHRLGRKPLPDDFGIHLSESDHRDMIKVHEGRHRLSVAIELGETVVPVQVWVRYKETRW